MRGGITAPWDVQNAAADVWSCTVSARSERASCASPSCDDGYYLYGALKMGRGRTLPAMMASSGARRGAWGARRACAAATSYAVDVWRKSAVCSRARLAGDAGVVDSKYARKGAGFGEDA